MLYKKKISAEKKGGERFGRLLVVEPNCATTKFYDKVTGRTRIQHYHKCLCDCGKEKVVRIDHLKSGATSSCGCLQKEAVKESGGNTKHRRCDNPMYFRWQKMKQRCNNPNNPKYHRYGGRGIKFSKEWEVFETFYADMGDPPGENWSIDRIDNDKGYSKENCRWATATMQANNSSKTVKVDIDGELRPLAVVARERGVKWATVYHRLHRKTWDNPDLFAAVEESDRGKVNGRLIEFGGKSMTIKQWADEIGIPLGTLCARLKKNMPLEKALAATDKIYGKTYMYKGEMLGVTALAKALGISQTTLSGWFSRGLSFEDVLKKLSK